MFYCQLVVWWNNCNFRTWGGNCHWWGWLFSYPSPEVIFPVALAVIWNKMRNFFLIHTMQSVGKTSPLRCKDEEIYIRWLMSAEKMPNDGFIFQLLPCSNWVVKRHHIAYAFILKFCLYIDPCSGVAFSYAKLMEVFVWL